MKVSTHRGVSYTAVQVVAAAHDATVTVIARAHRTDTQHMLQNEVVHTHAQ
jgi:hypothetical protein